MIPAIWLLDIPHTLIAKVSLQTGCKSELWTNGNLLSRYIFFKPRDLPGKWPRDFSAEELDIVGTVETYCEAVMFKRAMLIDVMMDRKFVSRSKSLEGDYQSNGKGRPDSKVEGCPRLRTY